MSSMIIRKSSPEIIRPAGPEMTPSTIDLSSLDKDFGAMPATCFLVFDHGVDKPVETIKRGLSRALVFYYPIAGRLAAGDGGGEVRVLCNGEGVVFVEARADCALKDARFYDTSSGASATSLLPDDLAVYFADDTCRRTDPLLLVQVTAFACGGFVVGATWNHAIADGVGMAQFLQAVGELASGLPAPSVAPVRRDGSLPGLPPDVAYAQQSMTGLAPRDFACFDYTVPSSTIDGIKAEFRRDHANGGGQTCTVFEAVTAALWRCRTRAVVSDPGAPSLLLIVANVREHVGAKAGYYGNCVTGQLVVATAGSVANGPIAGVVKMIKHAKEQIPKQFTKQETDGGGGGGGGDRMRRSGDMLLRYNYNLLVVSSRRNIGLDKVEVCGVEPVRVMCRAREPNKNVPYSVVCLPWKGKDGANMVTRCVREEHVEAFRGELTRFTT
ncbi:hypothetical protein BS78_02G113600 [Paspalum vaginatum]|nr:hypothetical protein BS78_02G113600 [Paspalum vaginatum]